MSTRGHWQTGLLDVTLLMLGTMLLVADGFDRVPPHLRVRLPYAEGADGPLWVSSNAFPVLLGRDRLRVHGRDVDLDELVVLARRARAHGADQADVVLCEPGVSAERYLAVLAALRRSGFELVRMPTRVEAR